MSASMQSYKHMLPEYLPYKAFGLPELLKRPKIALTWDLQNDPVNSQSLFHICLQGCSLTLELSKEALVEQQSFSLEFRINALLYSGRMDMLATPHGRYSAPKPSHQQDELCDIELFVHNILPMTPV
ncbi:hypothetical protein AVEN_120995-1 [Araneus ventricosus]|uniref:Uncharacterized protein n=1 Tax=Araneus ventricosus TaxID=182803 RepID=A0A4Y2HFN2_ARAVE|nr:hypothetical protein AVEN_120995-1 [Araneus ventricosus]